MNKSQGKAQTIGLEYGTGYVEKDGETQLSLEHLNAVCLVLGEYGLSEGMDTYLTLP